MNKNIDFTYETSDNSNYISTVLDGGVINYQLEMLTNNDIKNLLKAHKIRRDNSVKISYNITSLVSLEYMTGKKKLTRSGFFALLNGMLDAYDDIREYQLVNAGIVLDKRYVYINAQTGEPSFIYLPVYEKDGGLEIIKGFFNGLILEGCIEVSADTYIQVFLEMINAKEFNMKKLREFVNKYSRTASTPTYASASAAHPVEKTAPADIQRSPAPADIRRPAPDPERKKQETNKEKVVQNEKKTVNKNGIIKFGLLQIGVAVLIIGLVTQGILIGSDGSLKTEYLAATVILVGALEAVAFKYMVLNGNSKQTDKKREPSRTDNSVKKPAAPMSVNKPTPPAASVKPVAEHTNKKTQSDEKSVLLENDDDERTVIDGYDGYDKTEIIQQGYPYLMYFDNGLPIKIMITKPRMVIGRQSSRVDAVLTSKRVGKVHAEFITENGRYYIVDCESLNGTYINNGQRIACNERHEVSSGDKIRFADTETVFNIADVDSI